MIRKYIIFKGQVQNVGFRFFVCNIATKYKVTGYIRNLKNKELVECELQAADNIINQTLKEIIVGNIFIKVNDYSLKNIPVVNDETEFTIKY